MLCLGQCKLVQLFWKTFWQYLFQFYMFLLLDSDVTRVRIFSVYFSKCGKYVCNHDNCTLFVVAKSGKQYTCPLVGEHSNTHEYSKILGIHLKSELFFAVLI